MTAFRKELADTAATKDDGAVAAAPLGDDAWLPVCMLPVVTMPEAAPLEGDTHRDVLVRLAAAPDTDAEAAVDDEDNEDDVAAAAELRVIRVAGAGAGTDVCIDAETGRLAVEAEAPTVADVDDDGE